jgi:hypothetical protein
MIHFVCLWPQAPCCASLTRAAPRCVPFTATSRRSTVSVRAGPESNGVSASSSGAGSLALTKPIPGLAYPRDTETIRDVMAFAGPLPEVNGLLYMFYMGLKVALCALASSC